MSFEMMELSPVFVPAKKISLFILWKKYSVNYLFCFFIS